MLYLLAIVVSAVCTALLYTYLIIPSFLQRNGYGQLASLRKHYIGTLFQVERVCYADRVICLFCFYDKKSRWFSFDPDQFEDKDEIDWSVRPDHIFTLCLEKFPNGRDYFYFRHYHEPIRVGKDGALVFPTSAT